MGYQLFIVSLSVAVIVLFLSTYKKIVLVDVKRIRLIISVVIFYLTLPAALFVSFLPLKTPVNIAIGVIFLYYYGIGDVLKRNNIFLLGRNGNWDYINMDSVIKRVKEFSENNIFLA